MSEQTADTLSQKATPEFRGSLVRTVLISLILIALLPAAIIGTTSYLRFRSSLQTQTYSQLSSLAQTYSFQIEQLSPRLESDVVNFASSSQVNDAFLSSSIDSNNLSDATLNAYMQSMITSLSPDGVFAIYTVNGSNQIILSSRTNQIGQDLPSDKYLRSLVGTANSSLLFNPGGMYPNQLIIVTAFTKQMSNQTTPTTFLFFSDPSSLATILHSPLSYFTSANVYFISAAGQFVSLNPVMQTPELTKIDSKLQKSIIDMAATSGNGKNFSYTNLMGKAVYAYIRPIPMFNSDFVIEVPIIDVQAQVQVLLNFILILLAGTLLISGVVAFIGARQIAVPLVDLSAKARKFATGDFSQKANVNRRDEIGLLASSFNFMVDQLATFYSSLEAKVADRTEQLRTASEIAMDAVSAATTNDILQRVVESIVEKLGYGYASIYLLDKSGKNLVLAADHSNLDEKMPDHNLRLPVGPTSLIGWTAANRQARLSQNVLAEHPQLASAPLMASTHSEIALPIMIAERLIGILDIQSDQPNTFDFESMPAFTTLTNQIATGLRNIELLESTQLTLQETAALYSASRSISQAQVEDDVVKEVNTLFSQSAYVSFFLNVNGGEIRLVGLGDASTTASDKSLIGAILPFTNALNSLAANGMEVIDNLQISTDFSGLNAFFGRRGCRSLAVLPVFEGKQLMHVLAIGSREETPLTSLQIQPYTSLAEAIGTSLERIHLSNSLSQKERDISLLSQVDSTIESEAEMQTAYEAIHKQIREANGENIGFCVALFDLEKNLIQIPYYCGNELLQINPYAVTDDLLSQILKSGDSILLNDASINGLLTIDSPDQHLAAKSWLGLPMFTGNQVFGAIAVFTTDTVASFNQDTNTVLHLLASRLALAIFIDKQNQSLSELQNQYTNEKYLLDSLLENIPDRISFKNTNNEFIRISQSLAEYLGYPETGELVGKTDEFQYIAENDRAASEEVISTQTPLLNHTEQWINQQGNLQWMNSNRIPLVDADGSVKSLLSISNDITDLVQARQLAEHRANQLLTASEIARESTAGTMDVDITLARLVDLIKSRFDFYHASIFLLDPLGRNAVLRESTGEAGAQLKQAGHKLAVGSASIVGQATGKGNPVVVGDVTKEPNYFANPLLPDTRSELAIPMKIGEKVLGAVDVQSKELDAFSEEDINILQILANQIAVAVQNEDLFTHTNQSLSRHRLLHQVTSTNVESMTIEDAIRTTLDVLRQAMPDEQITYFESDQKEVLTARASVGIKNPDQTSRRIPFGRGVVGRAASEGLPIQVDDVQSSPAFQPLSFEANSILAVPVKFADTLLGVLNIESTALAQFDENDEEFVTTLAANMASIISNIRLIEQVRDQVNRQQKLIEITSKIRRSVDIETIMQTSVSEIGNALNARRASINISPKFEAEAKKEQGQ